MPKKTFRPGPAQGPGPRRPDSGRPLPPSPLPGAPAVRINKALAAAGVCSRRAADELVAQGRVRVNGAPAQKGQAVDLARDRVEVDGKRVDLLPAHAAGGLTLMLHKPPGAVTTARDPQGRPTVFDLLPREFQGRRLMHVGRLDFFSEGLILLTDDGELCHRLTHPRRHLPRTYAVTVREKVPAQALEAMRQGMTLAEGETLAPAQVEVMDTDERKTRLRLVLVQGVNRQIRRMCRDLGLTILKLVRVALGPLELGKLKSGESRMLTDQELAALRRSVGLA